MLAESIEEGRTGRGFRFGFFYFYGVHFLCECVLGVTGYQYWGGREDYSSKEKRFIARVRFRSKSGSGSGLQYVSTGKGRDCGEGNSADRRGL